MMIVNIKSVIKWYNKLASRLNRPNPIPVFQTSSKFKKSFMYTDLLKNSWLLIIRFFVILSAKNSVKIIIRLTKFVLFRILKKITFLYQSFKAPFL